MNVQNFRYIKNFNLVNIRLNNIYFFLIEKQTRWPKAGGGPRQGTFPYLFSLLPRIISIHAPTISNSASPGNSNYSSTILQLQQRFLLLYNKKYTFIYRQLFRK